MISSYKSLTLISEQIGYLTWILFLSNHHITFTEFSNVHGFQSCSCCDTSVIIDLLLLVTLNIFIYLTLSVASKTVLNIDLCFLTLKFSVVYNFLLTAPIHFTFMTLISLWFFFTGSETYLLPCITVFF